MFYNLHTYRFTYRCIVITSSTIQYIHGLDNKTLANVVLEVSRLYADQA